MSAKSPYKKSQTRNIINTLEHFGSVQSQEKKSSKQEPSTKEMFSCSSPKKLKKIEKQSSFQYETRRKSKFNISNPIKSGRIILERIEEDSSSLSQVFTTKKIRVSDYLSNLSYPDGTFSIANGLSLDRPYSQKSHEKSARSKFFTHYGRSKFSSKDKIFVARELCSKEEKLKEIFVEEKIKKYEFGGSRGLFEKSRMKEVEEDSFESVYSN